MQLDNFEIDPCADYPPHRHVAPEVYYVLEGKAECMFGDSQFIARKSTVIKTAANEIHSFKTLGPEKFVAIGMWWAPWGDEKISTVI